ncbi:MAG: lipoprotein [Neisseriaceae bacterium]|nr:lipoprotein [Neisseriaceae bacterium]
MIRYVICLILFTNLSACGFKGDLYLPKENDNAKFSPIQTGIGLTPPTHEDNKNDDQLKIQQ